jgi:hypothetical protein
LEPGSPRQLFRRVNLDGIVARPEKHLPRNLEEAVAELKRDPSHAVYARIDDLDVEVRVVADGARTGGDDVLGRVGPWKGESTEELLRVLREARESDERDARLS